MLPRDRFAGIRPIDAIGQITLKPRSLGDVAYITLNANASGGSVRVELLSEDGYRMRGFSKDDAVAIHGDALRHQVAWKEKSVSDLPAGQYRLRIYLDNAEVFAIGLARGDKSE
ncbi:MAG: hypothetical protein ACC645_20840 [Pirellulales bacterium]